MPDTANDMPDETPDSTTPGALTSTPLALRTSPLAELHRYLDGRMTPFRGVELPADYGSPDGSPDDEVNTLHLGCGLLDGSWMTALEMRGKDRQRFLNGLVTCEVKSLSPGQGTYGFVTNLKGRVLADLSLFARPESLLLALPPGHGAICRQHFEKYLILDQVELVTREDLLPISLIGPRADDVLAALELEAPQDVWSHHPIELCGHEVLLVREPPLGDATVFSLWLPSQAATTLVDALLQRGSAQGLRPVGHQAYEILRVEAGRPVFGKDFDDRCFPQETGLEDSAVSYTKGCYLGQEIVARIHYRGGVNRHLRGLIFEEAAEEGADISFEGRGVGMLGSAVSSPRLGAIGLTVLHQRAAVGARVDVGENGHATVVELPFAVPDPG